MGLQLFERVEDGYVALGGRHISLISVVADPFVDAQLFSRLDAPDRRPAIEGFSFRGPLTADRIRPILELSRMVCYAVYKRRSRQCPTYV